ncbi:MAG: hypothetical protein SAK29_34135, partial [Scytonema sp. PMC 1069.18]|nr:hypothetical protein [Scytonema sp. PMC 1069.18]
MLKFDFKQLLTGNREQEPLNREIPYTLATYLLPITFSLIPSGIAYSQTPIRLHSATSADIGTKALRDSGYE